MTLRLPVVLALVAIGFAPFARAGSISLSPDVTVTLDGVDFADESVAVDNLLGITVPTSLGTLPANAAVTAYHLLDDGDQLFALDAAGELAGPLVVFPNDVVRYDGMGYAIEFDGSTAGVPESAAVDAVSRTAGGDLLLSFDTTVDVGGTTVSDEDLVSWNGMGFSLVFDGSAQGIDTGADLDAADDAGGGVLLLSFDVSGHVGGVDFDDEDVLRFDPSAPAPWSLAYDGSALHASLAAADVEALPEAPQLLMLASGVALLGALRRRRRSVRARRSTRDSAFDSRFR